MSFNCVLCDPDGIQRQELTLPFPPYPGLRLRAEWLNGEWVLIDEVLWEQEDQYFTCVVPEGCA